MASDIIGITWTVIITVYIGVVIVVTPIVLYKSLPYYERSVSINGKEVVIYRGDFPTVGGMRIWLASLFGARNEEAERLSRESWQRFQQGLDEKEKRILRKAGVTKGTG